MTNREIDARALITEALQAREQAYAPYSRYKVGAAVLTSDGTVVRGCNVENASYPAAICAERVALTGAIAQGKRSLVALAVVTETGGSPCGICRQVMAELGPEMSVYIGKADGEFRATSVKELLPDAFGSNNLAV